MAQVGLTTLFGMGRGGPHRRSHLKKVNTIRVKFVGKVSDNVFNEWDKKG